jgi:2-polyprenyl-6-methoxyphenol hydroxylase-like FAD-dependent oxidoreductase
MVSPAGHAIVIGASMSGLLAARVLADHYERVTLLERDSLPRDGEPRTGVPQGRHAHGLLAQGRIIIEQLFPGFTADLAAQGVERCDITFDVRTFNNGGFHIPHRGDLEGLLVSRPLLETAVRDRVLKLPAVTLIPKIEALGLVGRCDESHPARRVIGVKTRGVRGGAPQVLQADLVVDASGRRSAAPLWLQALGYPQPPEEALRIGLGYTTRMYRRRPNERVIGAKGCVIVGSPSHPRGGVLLQIEGDRWILSLAGFLGDHAPRSDQGMREFARGMQSRAFADFLSEAEAISEPTSYLMPSSRRRRYEHLPHFPQGFLVIGDAICSFNPIYGQGMTVAALEARALASELAKGGEPRAAAFFKSVSRIVDIPWGIVVGNDARIPGVEGPQSFAARLAGRYFDRLHVAARHDAVVSAAFHRVANMIEPPARLFRPDILFRVLRGLDTASAALVEGEKISA